MLGNLIVGICLVAPAAPAQAKREVEEVYRRFARCWENEDVQGLAKIMHPGGVSIGRDGSRWLFRNLRRDLAPMFAERRNGHIQIRIDKVQVFGVEAQVWLTSTDSFEQKTKSGWKKVSGRGTFYERLENSGARWRIVESVELSGGQ